MRGPTVLSSVGGFRSKIAGADSSGSRRNRAAECAALAVRSACLTNTEKSEQMKCQL